MHDQISQKRDAPGANPTTLSYNASVVRIYSATDGMARFYYKNIFL
jgi:hypothetical protein